MVRQISFRQLKFLSRKVRYGRCSPRLGHMRIICEASRNREMDRNSFSSAAPCHWEVQRLLNCLCVQCQMTLEQRLPLNYLRPRCFLSSSVTSSAIVHLLLRFPGGLISMVSKMRGGMSMDGTMQMHRVNLPSSHSFSFALSPVPSSPCTSTLSPFWTLSITSLSKLIFASAFRVKVISSLRRAMICIACEPMSKKMTMKNVAGFHSLDAGDFEADDARGGFLRRNLGMTDCHKEGWATRGRECVDTELMQRVLSTMHRWYCKVSTNKHELLLHLGSVEWKTRCGSLHGTVDRRPIMNERGIIEIRCS